MVGKTISHYKILEKLGEGGMGVVYKAQDTKLDRLVAIKFLPQHLTSDSVEKERFVHEAKAASALNHPNITTVHEIDEFEGQMFIVMEYCEGKTLKQTVQKETLLIKKVLDIAIQICEGLAIAHEKGIVHRDIKSENIMLTPRGQVKIMDFGLAKLAGGVQLAKAGTTMGTAAYMSPEQASGKEVDHRTDIWSLGVVLYEMITGQLPFKGEYEEAILYSILNEEPEPITSLRGEVPTELKQIVDKAFVKNLNSRYQNAGEILIDLKKLKKELKFGKEGPFAERSQPSIAVLPFVNLSADKEQEYFCDGMAEEIINALTHVEDLRVVARTSAFSFRGKEIDIREIGRKLNVETLLEGSVRKAGSRVRITAQLISVTDGYHLWSERYDRDIGALCCPEDIFAIQDDISLTIVDKLKVKLLKGEKTKLVKRHTEDLDAYNLYLKGRYFWNRRTEESLKKSIDCFNQAIEKDPGYALAYAGLADSYVTLQDYSSLSPKVTLPKAKQAAYKALEIDGTLAEARNSLAQVMFREWDWQGAEKEHKRAIELNPNYASAHHWYALVLAYAARFDEAIAEMKRAWELDPLSLIINRNLGLVLCFAHRYDKAIKQLQKTLEMDPSFSLAHASLGLVYLRKAMYQEALTELQKESDIRGGADAVVETWKGIAYAKAGRKSEAHRILGDLLMRAKQVYVSPVLFASLYFALGENDLGFKLLDQAYDERDSRLLEIKVIPEFDIVRTDPRFKALLKKVGL